MTNQSTKSLVPLLIVLFLYFHLILFFKIINFDPTNSIGLGQTELTYIK